MAYNVAPPNNKIYEKLLDIYKWRFNTMKCCYQTRLVSIAKVLKDRGFKFTLKNKIYEFEYNQELGKILEDLRK